MKLGEIEIVKKASGLQPYSSRVGLKKLGREYRALCPFHSDHNPSLTVYEKDGQFKFKCWGCDASGDVIDFVQKVDKLSFKDAAIKLALLSGLNHYDH